MRDQDVFVHADEALNAVVAQIRDDQWDMAMPADFATRSQEAMTLRKVIDYHAYDDAWVPDMLAGRTMAEVGQDAFEGDLLGEDPKARFAAIVATACAAVAACDDLDRTVHCSFGDYPAQHYLWQVTSFRGLRSWDIARVVGASTRMPDALVQGLWEQLEPVADEWRTYGVFGARVEVAQDASLQDRLLALTGRDPSLARP